MSAAWAVGACARISNARNGQAHTFEGCVRCEPCASAGWLAQTLWVCVPQTSSRFSRTRKVVDVVFSYTNRNTDVVEKFFTRADVTEEFSFLVIKRGSADLLFKVRGASSVTKSRAQDPQERVRRRFRSDAVSH